MIVRQGDVVLRQTQRREVSEPAKEHVLAVGEESGHWHALFGVLEEVDGRRLVTVEVPALLRVEGMPGRHEPIEIGPGTWEVLIEQEYRPGQLPRQVAD